MFDPFVMRPTPPLWKSSKLWGPLYITIVWIRALITWRCTPFGYSNYCNTNLEYLMSLMIYSYLGCELRYAYQTCFIQVEDYLTVEKLPLSGLNVHIQCPKFLVVTWSLKLSKCFIYIMKEDTFSRARAVGLSSFFHHHSG